MICAVQSADRDETQFGDANEFDISRDTKPFDSIGFGWGTHRCLGEWFVRQELEIAFRTLFGRLPDLQLADGVAVADLIYTPPEQNVGILELPVVW